MVVDSCQHIVIATGARQASQLFLGLGSGGSSDVCTRERLPDSVAILGAGYIAVELAGVLHALGVKTDLLSVVIVPCVVFDSYHVEGLVNEIDRFCTHKVPSSSKTGKGITIYFEDGSILTSKLSGLRVRRQM